MTCSDRVHRRSPNATAFGKHSSLGCANIVKVDHQANGNEGNGLARKTTGAVRFFVERKRPVTRWPLPDG